MIFDLFTAESQRRGGRAEEHLKRLGVGCAPRTMPRWWIGARCAPCGFACAVVLCPVLATPAIAQTHYPTRVVTLVNPFAPGAATDIIARLIAQQLTQAWGTSMVVENRPGASGLIGLSHVARAPADGHTLAMLIITHATAVALGTKPAIDLVKDFAHITLVATQPYTLVVNPSLPARNIKELVALARSQPGALTYGSSGIGSVLHLAGELLAVQTNVKMTHVPYKGAALALSDVAGGHLAMLFTTRMSAQAMVNAKRVRIIAVTSPERVPGAPDLPTVQESGVTGPFDVSGWYGIAAPVGTPAAIVERLNQDIQRVMRLPDVRERMAGEGTMVVTGTPAQYAELVRAEVEKWRRIIKQAGITPETR
ncbi:MAG: tripartite tricarboxylate transporter substrate binding protein [Betaproteobacteria bacterium]|nr:tripartite tricarboxylate transporter substrate binding protein [Betaproteobacteria bacterium]